MRKTAQIVIEAPGRDQGKVFLITEMPAMAAERWATRAFLALARSGVDIPENIAAAGLGGVAALGLSAVGGLRFEDAEPLLAEMMDCVVFVPDASRPNVTLNRAMWESQVEEVATLLTLRVEVFKLHTGFSQTAAPLA